MTRVLHLPAISNLAGLTVAGIDCSAVTDTGDGSSSGDVWTEAFERQFVDLVGAIRDGREPTVSSREGRRSVELVERCYAVRRTHPHPWETSS